MSGNSNLDNKKISNETSNTLYENNKQCRYRHLFVIIESYENNIIPVSLEMLGEARRLMDDFNQKYHSNEKVVAVILGQKVKEICSDLIAYGADSVIFVENPELRYHVNHIDTKIICQIVTNHKLIEKISPEYANDYVKPRYMFFAADNIGRQLSATVLAELDSGLASDINKLVISDIEITHRFKTNGKPIRYEKTLEMYRPDFSGFLWTTILCLDNKNPEIAKDYHPQACSIIPGIFKPLEKNINRKGFVIEYTPNIDKRDLQIKVLKHEVIKDEVNFDRYKIIISFGRGIKDDPINNIDNIEELAKILNAEVGISLPISKKIFVLNDKINSKFIIPGRVVGTSGRKVAPSLYIAVGISGAIQHWEGMKDSDFIIVINPDENVAFRNNCDLFIKGRMEDVVPKLILAFKKKLSPQIKVSR